MRRERCLGRRAVALSHPVKNSPPPNRIGRGRGRSAVLTPASHVHRRTLTLDRRHPAAGVHVSLDEPFQHFQFAGRADLLARDADRAALLHVENRTCFPNIGETFGSYNAKRRYMPSVIAERLGLRGGFRVVTNVIVALWSSEVLHVVRRHRPSFSAVCPSWVRK